MKQTLERLYVACGLKEFLADITEETLKGLPEADLEIKNGFCEECLVKVDIVGVQVNCNILNRCFKALNFSC